MIRSLLVISALSIYLVWRYQEAQKPRCLSCGKPAVDIDGFCKFHHTESLERYKLYVRNVRSLI